MLPFCRLTYFADFPVAEFWWEHNQSSIINGEFIFLSVHQWWTQSLQKYVSLHFLNAHPFCMTFLSGQTETEFGAGQR